MNARHIVVGTLRLNRKGVPKDLAQVKLKRGDMDFRRSMPIAVLVWYDKRNVSVISTMHDASMAPVPGKPDKNGNKYRNLLQSLIITNIWALSTRVIRWCC